jgi:hypothetical protein
MDIDIVTTETKQMCNRIQITMDNFRLKAITGACRVFFYDANNVVIKVERVEIPEEVYTNWGTDDQVIIDYVLGTLFLQEDPVVTE